jgi:hypothetical protein
VEIARQVMRDRPNLLVRKFYKNKSQLNKKIPRGKS